MRLHTQQLVSRIDFSPHHCHVRNPIWQFKQVIWLLCLSSSLFYLLPFFRLLASRLGADTLTLLIIVLIASISGTLFINSFSLDVAS